MNKRCKIYLIFFLTTNLLMITFLLNNQAVSAAENFSDVINNAPVGLNIQDYFDIKQPSHTAIEDDQYPYNLNSATTNVVPTNMTDPKNGRILNLARGYQTSGAAWSNIDKSNYININQDQTVSVWLYFGGDGSEKDSSYNGEGISLVLHNDNRQAQALGAGLEGMGVLGFAKSTLNYTKMPIGPYDYGTGNALLTTPYFAAKTAVQNSIALTFDSEVNNANAKAVSASDNPIVMATNEKRNVLGVSTGSRDFALSAFDTVNSNVNVPTDFPEYAECFNGPYLSKFHYPIKLGSANSSFGNISLTYPSNPLSYHETNNIFNLDTTWNHFNKALSVFQVASQAADLVNSKSPSGQTIYWHHLTFKWHKAQDGQPPLIEYTLNDKYPDGTINDGKNSDYKVTTAKIPVDASTLDAAKDGKVYWGLTGANSYNAETYSKLAVFESIPALTTATASMKIQDNTTGKEINSTNPFAYINDQLQLDYHLQFDSSSHKDWQNIMAKLNLPHDLKYQAAKIVYHGKTGDTTEEIPLSSDSPIDLSYTLTHDLGNLTDSNNPTSADIILISTAQNATSVTTQTARFAGTDAI